MWNTIKNFRNARWFRGHWYAYSNLLGRRRNRRRGKPFLWSVELCIDTRCNFTCEHCSTSMFRNQPDFKRWMTLDEIRKVANKLKSADCFLCCLAGGEPTLRPDLCEIVSVFSERKILPTIITNGYLLDKQYIRELKQAGLFNLGFRLNGFSSETHDRFVRKSGAFEKAMENIRLARKSGMCVSIVVVPTHENLSNGEFRKLIHFAIEKKIRANVSYPALCGEYSGSNDVLLDEEERKEVREYFRFPNVTGDFTVLSKNYECPAARKKISILSDGSVCPCGFIHISFGNILQQPLTEIMDRLWSADIFMSHSKCCLVGESAEFNRQYMEPVFRHKYVPMYYADHPMFADVQSVRDELAEKAKHLEQLVQGIGEKQEETLDVNE